MIHVKGPADLQFARRPAIGEPMRGLSSDRFGRATRYQTARPRLQPAGRTVIQVKDDEVPRLLAEDRE